MFRRNAQDIHRALVLVSASHVNMRLKPQHAPDRGDEGVIIDDENAQWSWHYAGIHRGHGVIWPFAG